MSLYVDCFFRTSFDHCDIHQSPNIRHICVTAVIIQLKTNNNTPPAFAQSSIGPKPPTKKKQSNQN
jgi:hypothetical protein